jgi:hypothetical protein
VDNAQRLQQGLRRAPVAKKAGIGGLLVQAVSSSAQLSGLARVSALIGGISSPSWPGDSCASVSARPTATHREKT